MAWHRPSQVLQLYTRRTASTDAVGRMDKFYMLIRRFVSASFALLIRNDWSPALCEEHNAILRSTGGPLWYVDRNILFGLAYPRFYKQNR